MALSSARRTVWFMSLLEACSVLLLGLASAFCFVLGVGDLFTGVRGVLHQQVNCSQGVKVCRSLVSWPHQQVPCWGLSDASSTDVISSRQVQG